MKFALIVLLIFPFCIQSYGHESWNTEANLNMKELI